MSPINIEAPVVSFSLSACEHNSLISAITINRTQEIMVLVKRQKAISQDCHNNLQKVIRKLIEFKVKHHDIPMWIELLGNISIVDSYQAETPRSLKCNIRKIDCLGQQKAEETEVKNKSASVYVKEERQGASKNLASTTSSVAKELPLKKPETNYKTADMKLRIFSPTKKKSQHSWVSQLVPGFLKLNNPT